MAADSDPLSLDVFLSADPAPAPVDVAKSEEAKPAEPEVKSFQEQREERALSLARMRATYPSIIIDPLNGPALMWEFSELMADLDPDDKIALGKFFNRERIAKIIQAGLLTEKILITKNGPDTCPDTATRMSWMKVMMEFTRRREVKEPRKPDPETPAGDGPDFFEGLRGKPGMRRKIREKLEAMDREEGIDGTAAA